MPSSNLDRSIILTTIVVQRTDVRPKQTFTLEIDIFIIELTTKLKIFVLGVSNAQWNIFSNTPNIKVAKLEAQMVHMYLKVPKVYKIRDKVRSSYTIERLERNHLLSCPHLFYGRSSEIKIMVIAKKEKKKVMHILTLGFESLAYRLLRILIIIKNLCKPFESYIDGYAASKWKTKQQYKTT